MTLIYSKTVYLHRTLFTLFVCPVSKNGKISRDLAGKVRQQLIQEKAYSALAAVLYKYILNFLYKDKKYGQNI